MKTTLFKMTIIVLAVTFSACAKDLEPADSLDQNNEFDIQSRTLADDAPFFYTDKGTKEYLSIRRDIVMIKTASDVEAKALVGRGGFLSKQQVRTMGTWVQASIDAKTTNLDDILKLPGVVDASHGLEYANGVMQYLTDQIFIQCAEPKKALTEIGIAENIVNMELFNEFHDIYLVTLSVKSQNILRICQQLYELGLCKFAEPNFIVEAKLHNTTSPASGG